MAASKRRRSRREEQREQCGGSKDEASHPVLLLSAMTPAVGGSTARYVRSRGSVLRPRIRVGASNVLTQDGVADEVVMIARTVLGATHDALAGEPGLLE